MGLNSADFGALGVELTLTAGVVALLVGATMAQSLPRRWPAWVVAVTILIALCVLAATTFPTPHSTFCGGMILSDGLSRFWKASLLMSGLGLVVMEAAAPPRPISIPRWTLLLGAMAGFSLSASTGNLLLAMLALETSALSGYVLAAVGSGRRGNEAGLKLAILGSAAVAVMVLGFALASGAAGSLELPEIARSLSGTWHPGGIAVTALLLVCVGFAFKLAAVPFHTWAPDVMEGGDASAAAMLSMLSKGVVIVLAVRWLGIAVGQMPGGVSAEPLAIALAAVSVVTMTFGNLGALRQTSLRRMLGYSSVAQSGYLVAGLSAWVLVTPAQRPAVGGAVLVILVSYLPAALAAFAVAAAVERSGSGGLIRAGHAGSGVSGLASRHAWVAGSLALAMVSLIGLPPAVGVVGKTVLLVALGKVGAVGGGRVVFLTIVQGAIILNTLVAAVFYLNVIRAMYFENAAGNAGGQTGENRPRVDPITAALVVVCAAVLLAGLIGAGPLVRLASTAF